MTKNDVQPAGRASGAELSLLIVDDDEAGAAQLVEVLYQQIPALGVQRVGQLAEAYALLRAETYDLVLTNHRLPDGDSLDLLDFLDEASLDVPVVVQARPGRDSVAVAVMKAGASDYLRKARTAEEARTLPVRLLEAMRRHHRGRRRAGAAMPELLATLRTTLSQIKHDANNPLAIISGNAQLLLELARMLELGEEILQPVQDIEEAAGRIEHALNRLDDVRDEITGELGHVPGPISSEKS